jgi:signal transduction histidine kinase
MKRQNYFFFGVGIFLTIVIVSVFLLVREAEKRLESGLLDIYKKQENLVAEQIVLKFKLEIENIQNQLYFISSQPEIINGYKDQSACNSTLLDIKKRELTRVDNLSLVGKDGFLICSINDKYIGVKGETIWPDVSGILSDIDHKPIISRLVPSQDMSGHVVSAHIPVFDEEKNFAGIISGDIYLEDLYSQYLKDVILAERGFVVMFDDDGTIIYHPVKDLIDKNIESSEFKKTVVDVSRFKEMIENAKKGESGLFGYVTTGAEENIAAFRPLEILPGRHWLVLVTVPVKYAQLELASAGAGQIINLTGTILSLIIAVLGLAFLYFVRKVVFEPIEALDKAKNEFISIASHQLRTPLGSMRWGLELLQIEAEACSETAKKQLDQIYRSTLRMIQLVSDFLNVARIEQGRVKDALETVEIMKIIEAVIKEMEIEAGKKSIIISLNKKAEIPEIVIDVKRFREIIQNLISNAVRYTLPRGKVSVEVDLKDDFVIISVADTGIGIPEKEKAKIFTKFARAENATKIDHEGSGLGLYIVKAFVEDLGGKIWLESEEGKGSTFYVSLPQVLKEDSSKKK